MENYGLRSREEYFEAIPLSFGEGLEARSV